MKKEKLQWTPQKYKGSEETIQQLIGQHRGNGQILRKVQPSRLNQEKI